MAEVAAARGLGRGERPGGHRDGAGDAFGDAEGADEAVEVFKCICSVSTYC
jgi:hypothetical protein